MLDHQLEKFVTVYPPVTYKKYETIARADEEQLYLYFVDKGYVRQFGLSPDGDEITINIYRGGSYFYLAWALGSKDNRYFFEAINGVTLRRVPTVDMERFLAANNDAMVDLTGRLMQGLSATSRRLEILAFGNARQRVAAAVHNLAQRFGEQRGNQVMVTMPVTHRLIASIAGLARETASIEIQALKKLHLIVNQKRQLVVTDMDKLMDQTGMLV